MNGHTDVVMGAAMMNNDDVYTRLKFLQNCMFENEFYFKLF